jgi:CDP-paratose 2-epimerase
MKKILITGGAGFVGSSLAIRLKNRYPSYMICCLDNLKRRGSELNLKRLAAHEIEFIHGDVRNREDLNSLKGINLIIEASAEPSVLAGLVDTPDYLINTNLMGAINCLYLAARERADFIFISTSRVYPIDAMRRVTYVEMEGRFGLDRKQVLRGVTQKGFAEDFPLEGYRSMYGASKLSAELLIREFNQFCNIRTVINRCGLLAGPWQMGRVDQGVMVLWVAYHYWGKPLSYFGFGGQGKQVRDLLHVCDLCDLIDYQIHHMAELNGRLFNVGGGEGISLSMKELTALCQKITGNHVHITPVMEDRRADIPIYITDNSYVTTTTGWHPTIGPEAIISSIYEWIRENEGALKPILSA